MRRHAAALAAPLVAACVTPQSPAPVATPTTTGNASAPGPPWSAAVTAISAVEAGPTVQPWLQCPCRDGQSCPPLADGTCGPFNREVAEASLSAIASTAQTCAKPAGPTGTGRVSVVFAPSGHATDVMFEYRSLRWLATSAGDCLWFKFRFARVPPFEGKPVTMQQEFRLDPFELPPPVGTTIDPCVPTMDAGASASGRPFDREAAAACMTFIASEIHSCFTLEGPEGMGRITVVFEPSGNVMTSSVEAWPFAGTPTGRCVERKFRMAHVPPFEGDAVTIHKVFVLGPPKPPSPRADRDSGLWR